MAEMAEMTETIDSVEALQMTEIVYGFYVDFVGWAKREMQLDVHRGEKFLVSLSSLSPTNSTRTQVYICPLEHLN